MGSFAKKIGRAQKMRSKALMKDAVKEGRKLRAATNQVMDLTAEQMVNDLLVEADAIDDVSTILLLASNRAFGFGAKRIGELNKKNVYSLRLHTRQASYHARHRQNPA